MNIPKNDRKMCRNLCLKTNFGHTLTYPLFLHTIFPVIFYKLMQGWIHRGCGHPQLVFNPKFSPQNKYKTQNFAPAASNFNETNQLIFIYNSKIGKK